MRGANNIGVATDMPGAGILTEISGMALHVAGLRFRFPVLQAPSGHAGHTVIVLKGMRQGVLEKVRHLQGVAILVGAAADDAAVLEQVAHDGGAVGGDLGGRLSARGRLRGALWLQGCKLDAEDFPVHSPAYLTIAE